MAEEINVIVSDNESINVTLSDDESINLTLSDNESINVTLSESESINVTLSEADSINVTITSDTETGRVKLSSNDTTLDFLDTKLVAGTGIDLTINNDGGNETLTITNTGEANTFVGGVNIDVTESPDDTFTFDLVVDQDIDMNDNSLTEIESLQLSTDLTPLTSAPGLIQWNATDGTYDMGLLNSSVLQVGQETMFYGKASGAIANGDLCQFAGVQGDHILIKKAVGSEIEENPHYLVGVATENIANGEYGYVTWFGKVRDVYTATPNNQDAQDWTAGDILYFNVSTGQMTNQMPSVPDRVITVAAVIKEQTGASETGIIIVRPSFGTKFVDLDDVNGTPLTTDGQIAVWDQTNQYFDFTDNINNYLAIDGSNANTNISIGSYQLLSDDDFIGSYSSGEGAVLKKDTGLSLYYGNSVKAYFKYIGAGNLAQLRGDASNGFLISNTEGEITIGGVGTINLNNTDPFVTPFLVDVDNARIVNLTDPTNAQDAATKNYIDTNYLSTSTASSTYVPYTGATSDVNLGTNKIITYSGTGAETEVLKVGRGVSENLTVTFSDSDVKFKAVNDTDENGTHNMFFDHYNPSTGDDVWKFRSGTDNVDIFEINSNSGLYLSSDTLKFYQGAGNDYSQYFDGTNQVFELTSGDFIFSGGNVSIGTTSVDRPLTVSGERGDANANIPIKLLRNSSLTNFIVSSALLEANTSGNMTDGFGPRFRLQISDATSGTQDIASFGAVRDGADNNGKFFVQTTTSGLGGLTNNLTLDGSGNLVITGDFDYSGNLTNVAGQAILSGSLGNNVTDIPLRLVRNSPSTAAMVSGTTLEAVSSGNMTDGFGARFLFRLQDDTSALNSVAGFGAVRDGADDSGALIFQTGSSGTIAEALRIGSNKNVYLRNDNQKLYFGAGSDASIYYDGTDLYINPQEVGTGDTIFSAGNVGIGTTTPSSPLHIYSSGNTRLNIESSAVAGYSQFQLKNGTNAWKNQLNTGDFSFQDVSTNNSVFNLAMGSPANSLVVNSSGISTVGRLLVSGTGNTTIAGNVGIKTTAPVTTLDVGGWTGAPVDNNDINMNVNGSFFAGNTGTGVARFRMGSNSTVGFISYNNYYSTDLNTYSLDSTKPSYSIQMRTASDSIQFLRAPATAGALSYSTLVEMKSNGDLEPSGNLVLDADNQKAIFGTGSDASIYYDGTDLFINPREVGNGVLFVGPKITSHTSPYLYANGLRLSGGDEINTIYNSDREIVISNTTTKLKLSEGDIIIPKDNSKLLFGAGSDASIYYNGSDLYINPQEVGTGDTIFSAGNVGIGGSPNANAALDVSSTTKAFMPPRMTTTEKNAISSPTAGMVVFDTTLGKLCVYTTAWETITSA